MADRKMETPESTVFGPEEALAKISMELLNPQDDKLMTVTDLTPEEIFGIAWLKMMARKFGSDIVEDWCKDFMLMRISLLRKGRQEFLLLGTGIREAGQRKRGGGGVQDLFAGLR